MWPSPQSIDADEVLEKAIPSLLAFTVLPLMRSQTSTNSPMSHGQTVPLITSRVRARDNGESA
jgi:hypothetical protein